MIQTTMDRYRVKPDQPVDLGRWDPNDKGDFAGGQKEGKVALKALNERLSALQYLLYAEGKHKLLIVLQAMDTGGKDGASRHVFRGVNPQGVRVASFKAPTSEALAPDYLCRSHQPTPGSG